MITVLVSVKVKEGKIPDFIKTFKSNAEKVKKEKGCVEYFPTLDIDAVIAGQVSDPNVVTVVERWEDMESLQNHMSAPHMATYQKMVEDMMEGVTFRLLRDA